jgi:hypothetical protein
MHHAEVGPVTELQWKPVIYLPAQLTVSFGAEVLTAADPAPWCQGKAAEVLGPQASRKQVARLADSLTEHAVFFASQHVTKGAAYFYPDFTRLPPRAMSEIYLVGADPEAGPMTLARARQLTEPDERSVGETELTETELPAGPALRVHRFRKMERDKRRSRIGEEVDWIICPPHSTQAVMMLTSWSEPVFSKAAISIADEMAKNFRTEPADAAGPA